MQKTKSASKSEAASSRKAKIQEQIENTGVPSPKKCAPGEIPGRGRIGAAIMMENDLTGHAFAFPMKMFLCYRTLVEDVMQKGEASETKTMESIEALGALTEAAMYELGGFDERDIYACMT